MGVIDHFEEWRPYRWAWDRDCFGRRPFTHSARMLFGRRPGMVLYGCVCFAAGTAVRGTPADSLRNFLASLLFTLVNGHLWV